MSKAMIVSLLPIEIDETKPGMYPGNFRIPAAKENDFETLAVEDSIYYVHFVLDNRPPLKMTETADKIAASVVNDFITTVMGISSDAQPGLFWIPEQLDKKVIPNKYAEKFNKAKAQQVKWFTNLVQLADDEWVKSGRMHRSISSLQRAAAKFLNLERDWFIETMTEQGPTYCPACRTAIHPAAAICAHCRTIVNEAEYKKFKVASA